MHRRVDIFYDERSMKCVQSTYRINVHAPSTYKIYKTSVQHLGKKAIFLLIITSLLFRIRENYVYVLKV